MVDLPITKWIKKKIRRLIAIVEDTDVATNSIASGKYVVWKGDLYKSTAAIAVGGSLSMSNLSPVSDGGLNELSEQIGNKIKIVTQGSYGNITVNGSGYTDRQITVIPSGYTPISLAFTAVEGGNNIIMTLVNSDSNWYARFKNAGTSTIIFNCTMQITCVKE